MKEKTTVVIGAGVTGLSTALTLQTQYPTHKIHLITRDLPSSQSPNYASPWAGAHYRPIPGRTPQLLREETQARKTYAHFKTLSQDPSSGVQRIEAIEHLEDPPPEYLDTDAVRHCYGHLDGFRYLAEEEKPAGVKWGVRYDSFVVNSPVYCAYLLRRFVLAGGVVREYEVVDPREGFYLAQAEVGCVVDCSGMGFGDEKCFIIRGQTCLVRNPCNATITRQNADGSWSFCIPRPLHGGTIIGGTKQPRNYDPFPSLETRETLLRNAQKWFPFAEGVDQFDVIRDIVGRRPAREGGMRIEAEKVAEGTVVHAYGAGGRGYEISWGVAGDVLDLMVGHGLVGERASL